MTWVEETLSRRKMGAGGCHCHDDPKYKYNYHRPVGNLIVDVYPEKNITLDVKHVMIRIDTFSRHCAYRTKACLLSFLVPESGTNVDTNSACFKLKVRKEKVSNNEGVG